MRDISPETQAKHELAVIDALAVLGQAKIKQIVKTTGLDENGVRWALQRQKGISVEKIRHGTWKLLPEPGDADVSVKITRPELSDMAFEAWIFSQGIQHEGLILRRGHRHYLQKTRFGDIQINQVVCFANRKRFLRIDRIETIDERIRLWGAGCKTPALSGEPDQEILIRVTPDPKLYL